METFLVFNDYEIIASVNEQESIILKLASGDLSREEFTNWVKENTRKIK
jgi:death-on-curing protein